MCGYPMTSPWRETQMIQENKDPKAQVIERIEPDRDTHTDHSSTIL